MDITREPHNQAYSKLASTTSPIMYMEWTSSFPKPTEEFRTSKLWCDEMWNVNLKILLKDVMEGNQLNIKNEVIGHPVMCPH